MSKLYCTGCGRTTNTAVSHWLKEDGTIHRHEGIMAAEYCYAAYVDGKWIEGCGLASGTAFERHFANKLIKEDSDGRC